MNRHFIMLALLFLLMNVAEAQTKPPAKADTAKDKLPPKPKPGPLIKIDTPHVKFPLNIQNSRFDNIDSTDLNLTPDVPIAKYGRIDTSDLKMKSCNFEKDANAMVLFDRAEMACGLPQIVMIRQRRIKIFNDNGKKEANIRIEYNNRFGAEAIIGLEAETINLNNGKIEYTKLDPKLIYAEHTDKNKDVILFTMPNVKAGSVIEYRYIWERGSSRNVPDWAFQCDMPTRYSQLNIFINPLIVFTALYRKDQPFVRDTISMSGYGHVWAMANVPSVKDEHYMRSAADALQSVSLVISSVKYGGQTNNISGTWAEVGKEIANDKDFYQPFDQSLHDEDDLVKKAKALKTDDEKIAFLFNQVKTLMKWNEEKNWFSKDGIKSAWKKKSGNWGEINMILNRLLKLAGIKSYPMLVSTRDNGRLLSNFVSIFQINKLVTYVPVDSTKYYVLDATDKYAIYNEIPFDLLNSNGLSLNKEKEKYDLVFMKKDLPVKQVVLINAEIKPDGNMSGTAQINSFSYNKSNTLELYKTLDEKKYKNFLTDNDNNLKIASLKFENADIDSLPLTQNINFSLGLPGTDDKYIYFNPNLFTSLHSNPFISEDRVSDIDFGCSNIYSINGRYKIPDGYKIEALPKSMNLLIADKSITFKRIVAEQEGYVIVYYVISYKKSFYPQANYPDIHAYFKKMNEILNEQIVLKKS
jgi:Domain of Unknown Function with PDB structure (DUF3857)